MAFWESQSKRNEKRVDEAMLYFYRRSARLCSDSARRTIVQAWFTGAAALSRSMVDSTLLRSLWGKGDVRKAVGLATVCAVPMVSIWFRQGNEFPSPNAHSRETQRVEAAKEALEVAGSYSESSKTFFLNMASQYDYELDLYEAGEVQGIAGLHFSVLLLAAVRSVWDAPEVFDWRRQAFPVKNRNDYALVSNAALGELMGAAKGQDVNDFLIMPLSILDAANGMFEWYRLATQR